MRRYHFRPLVIPDHGDQITRTAVRSASMNGAVYSPMIPLLLTKGLIQPRGQRSGFAPTSAAQRFLKRDRPRAEARP